jgi:hypothetical protein
MRRSAIQRRRRCSTNTLTRQEDRPHRHDPLVTDEANLVGNFGNRQRNMRWGGELRGVGENEDNGSTSNRPSRNPGGSCWTLASNRQEPQIQDRTVRRGEHSDRQHGAPAKNRFSDDLNGNRPVSYFPLVRPRHPLFGKELHG